MARKPPSDISRGRGRPRLSDDDRTVKTTVRFDETTVLRVSVVRGNESMAEFVRRATEQRLLREEASLRKFFKTYDWGEPSGEAG